MASHAPSERPGACDPCRAGDHGSCTAANDDTPGTNPALDCTCYDDSWEFHDQLAYQRDVDPLTQPLGDLMPGGDRG